MRIPPRGALDNQVTLLIAVTGALLAALSVRAVLPAQFLLDDAHLRRAMSGGALATDAESFREVAVLYELLQLEHAAPLAALLGLGLYVLALLLALGWERIPQLSALSLLVALALLVPGLAYLAQYSKELLTVVVALVVIIAPARGRLGIVLGEMAVLAAALAYGAVLRPYWLLVAAAYLAWRVLLPRTSQPLLLLAVPLAGYAVLQPAFRIALGTGLQGQRDWSNAERADTAVNTVITSIAPGADGALGVLAALAMLGLLLVPVGLLASGDLFHLASGIAISAVWLLVLVPVLRGRLVEPVGPRGIRAVRAASLLLALVLVQALFEPDYGSALKHLTPLLPLVLLVHLHRKDPS